MTAVAPAIGRNPFGDLREQWRRTPPRTKTGVRVATVLAMVVIAYHYSLLSLFQSLGLETPLAYVGLAPVIALILAALRARTARPEPPIHDRQVDYIVGIPLLTVALAINLVFPHHLSTMFWVWRVDLFSLPFFVAGAVCTVFGIRAMWRQRLAIAFLFMAWPLPYQMVLLHVLTRFTDITLVALKAIVHAIPVATAVPSSDGSLFQVVHGRPFQISVVSACSGVNGMVGFLLVGAAFGAIVRGPRIVKTLWLAGGLFLLWGINLARILFIFWIGKNWGEKVAIDVFHPFVGLVTFNVGILLMVLALRTLGLTIDGALWAERTPSGTAGKVRQSLAPDRPRPAVAVPRVWVALVLVGVLGGTLSITNANLRSYDLVANALGTPRLAAFSDFPATPDGWRAQKSDEYDWAKPYFGASSTWLRYTMFPGSGTDVALQSSQAVTADVISTSNLRSFSAYGVEACYRFHGYKLHDVATVNLGGGVTAQALSFYNAKQQQDWTVVYWIWPVLRSATSTRYERVTLYIQDSGQTVFSTPASAAAHKVIGGLSGLDPVNRKLVNVRDFLVAFARGVVRNQSAVHSGTQLPAANNVLPPGGTTPAQLAKELKKRAAAKTAAATQSASNPAGALTSP